MIIRPCLLPRPVSRLGATPHNPSARVIALMLSALRVLASVKLNLRDPSSPINHRGKRQGLIII